MSNVNDCSEFDFPDLYKYLSAQQYLFDIFKFYKNQNPKFSFAVWAKQLCFENKDYLRMVVVGRRNINEVSVNLFIKGLSLVEADASHFRLLVIYSQSRSREQRDQIGKQLISKMRIQHNAISVQNSQTFLSSRYNPLIRTLLSIENIDRSSRSIAKALNLSDEQVIECLKCLESSGLAEKSIQNGQETWKASDFFVKVTEELGNSYMQNFTRQSLKFAQEAIDLPPALRRFRHIWFPVDVVAFQNFLEDFDQFISNALYKYGVNEVSGHSLYQFSTAFFPVSGNLSEISSR